MVLNMLSKTSAWGPSLVLTRPRKLAAIAACALVFTLGWNGGVVYKRNSMKRTAAHTALAQAETLARDEAAAKSKAVRALHAAALDDLGNIKRLSEMLEPRLVGEASPARIAKLLRNLVYSRVGWVSQPGVRVEVLDWFDLADSYRKSVLDPTYGHMCAGRSITYLIALRAFGLPARKVGILPSVNNLPEIPRSHASVEVMIGGRWVAEDPTFNISIVDEAGRPTGWVEAAKLLNNGSSVSFPADGFEVVKAYSLENFIEPRGIKFQDLIKYVNTSSYWDGSNRAAGVKFPEDWDGKIQYATGKIVPIFENNSKGILDLLSRSLK
jgi:hypothetical protein